MALDTCRTLKSTVLAASVAMLFVVGAGAAFSAGPPPAPAGQHAGPRGMMDSQRIEEHLTTLKADLKITEAQTPAWDGFADASAMHTAGTAMRPSEGTAPDALQRFEAMDAMAKTHAQNMDRLLAAFRPLYAQLNDEQRQVAAQKLMPPPPHRG